MAGIEIAKKEDLEKLSQDVGQKADSSDVPTKTSELENDSGFITSDDIPEIPDTSNLATKAEVEAKADSDHTHSYNDLSDTPSIPSVDGLATKDELSALEDTVAQLRTELDELKGDDGEGTE